MKYLLDTHYLLWSIANSSKIPKSAKDIIVDQHNQILVSTISFWEISLKFSIGKLNLKGFLPEDIPELCLKMNFEILNILAQECSSYHQLVPNYHKDPFDKMLIWQAISNDYILITDDNDIKKYASSGLKLHK